MRARQAVFALSLAALSCSVDPLPTTPPANVCARDSDCGQGVCDLTRHRCVATARAEVFFFVTPPDGRVTPTAVGTLTQPRTLGSGDAVDIDLRAPRTVLGVVTAPDPAATNPTAAAPIAATVRFLPTGLSDVLEPVEVPASTTLMGVGNAGGGHTWRVLVPDGSYDVVVTPDRSLLNRVPPRYERLFDVRADAAEQRFDLAYPATYARWRGVVVDPAGRPLTGLTVRAVDPSHDNALVSTVGPTNGSTGLPPGAFDIAMAPGAPDDWTLRIWSDTNAQGWLTVDLPHEVVARLSAANGSLRVELPDNAGHGVSSATRQTMGATATCVGCVSVGGSVEGRSTAGSTRPLRGATVTFRATLTLPGLAPEASARYEARAQTDATGEFNVSLLPGSYEVTVAPQQPEFAAQVVQGFLVRSDLPRQMGQVFALDPPLSVDGRVLTARGEPVRGARVEAVPFARAYVNHPCLADTELRALAPMAEAVTNSTTTDGTYRLDVTPGLYRVFVQPREGSGYAASLSTVLCVASRVRGLDLTLDPPVEVHGAVRDAQGRPQVGAVVQALARLREASAPGVVVPVGRATTGAGGAYTLLLPSSATLDR